MGLFDYTKKPWMYTLSGTDENDNSEAGERASVFKGDLARISESSAKKAPKPVHIVSVGTGQTTGDTGSTDSTVFMSFERIEKGYWICPECGTYNDEGLNECSVCACDPATANNTDDDFLNDKNKIQTDSQISAETELQRKIQEEKEDRIKKRHEQEWEEFQRRKRETTETIKDELRVVAWILIAIILVGLMTTGMR